MLAFLLARFSIAPAQVIDAALIYVWTPPGESSARISNAPPSWYRFYEMSDGPRVRVYRGKTLIDDTALTVAQRQALIPRPAPKPAPKTGLF